MSKKWLAVLPLIALSLTPSTVKADSWSTYRHDLGRSGYTSEKLVPPLAVNWKFSTLSVSGNPSSPAVTDNKVIFTAGSILFVVDATTGSERWNSGGMIEGVIKASPTVVDGVIYVGSSSGNLYAIFPAGPDQWRLGWIFHTNGPVRSSPVVTNNVVYFGSDDNCFYAVDAKEGKQIWKKKETGDISGAPALSDDRVIYTCEDLMTYAIDTTNEKGTRRWHFRTRLPSNYSAPVVEGDRVYIAAGNQLFCLSARTGRERWNYATVSDISCSPAIKDGVAYFTTRDSQFFAVGDRGKLKWKAKLDFPCYSAPSIAKDILYLGTNKGLVYAFDIKEAMDKSDVALSERKGKAPEILPKWKYRVQPAAGQLVTPDIVATPVVSGNALFVLPDDGTLNCLTAEAPDVDPPAISYQYPAKNSTVNGAPPLLLSAVLQDEGSGLNESTIAMYLDKDTAEVGELGGEGELEYSYDPIKGIVYFRTSAPGAGQPARPLKNGRHTITIEAADWKGNLLTTSWTFNVDNSLRPVTPSSDMNNGPMGGGMPGGMIGGMPH